MIQLLLAGFLGMSSVSGEWAAEALPAVQAELEAGVAQREAESIAQGRVGGVVQQSQLVSEGAYRLWQVDIQTADGARYDVLVSFSDGNVLRVRQH